MRAKQSYHTSLLVLHHAGLLPAQTKSSIPKSTLQSWKNRNLASLIGIDQARLVEENTELLWTLGKYEKLLTAAKVLLALFKIVQQTLHSFNEGKRRLFEKRTEFAELLGFASDKVSLSLLAKLLDTSVTRLKNLSLVAREGIEPRSISYHPCNEYKNSFLIFANPYPSENSSFPKALSGPPDKIIHYSL